MSTRFSYFPEFYAWFHHCDGDPDNDEILTLIEPHRFQCQGCEKTFPIKPPPFQWAATRKKNAESVRELLQRTDDPWKWHCISSRGDDVHSVRFDNLVGRWICTCYDFQRYASAFWGGYWSRSSKRRTSCLQTWKSG